MFAFASLVDHDTIGDTIGSTVSVTCSLRFVPDLTPTSLSLFSLSFFVVSTWSLEHATTFWLFLMLR